MSRNSLAPRPLLGSPLSTMLQQFAQRSLVKSIQVGTINLGNVTSATAAISAVSLQNALIFLTGISALSATTQSDISDCRVELTNATTVTAYHNASDASQLLVSYLVVEFVPGVLKSVQRGTVDTNLGTATATITAVNTLKSMVFHLGMTNNTAGAWQLNTNVTRVTLTNATTVTVTTVGSGATQLTGYQVAEFF